MSSTLGNVAASVVRLHKHYGDYKKATTALLKDGGVFGKLSLVEGRCQDVFAEAMTEARAAGTQKIAIERAIKRRPEFALRLCSSFAERLRQSDEVLEILLHREAATRLATLLLHLGEKFGEEDSAGVVGMTAAVDVDPTESAECTGNVNLNIVESAPGRYSASFNNARIGTSVCEITGQLGDERPVIVIKHS